MNTLEKTLLGSKSFLQFTLDHEAPELEYRCMLDNGVQIEIWDSGVLYFKPKCYEQADSILLSAGVHGNETAPIEIIDQLLNGILNGDIGVNQNLLIIFANPYAIQYGKRFIQENMNRLFQPKLTVIEQDSDERKRAAKLMKYSRRFFALGRADKFHYDLHTAIRDSQFKKFAISPNPFNQIGQQPSFSFLKQCGIEAILITDKKSATYSAYTARHCGAVSFTLELGKVKPFGMNDLTEFEEISRGLKNLINGQKFQQENPNSCPLLFRIVHEINKKTVYFRLPFSKDIANFTEFQINDLLALDINYQYRVTEPGERILFPNAEVAVGQRALVIIKPIEHLTI